MMSRRVFWVFCGFIIRAEITYDAAHETAAYYMCGSGSKKMEKKNQHAS